MPMGKDLRGKAHMVMVGWRLRVAVGYFSMSGSFDTHLATLTIAPMLRQLVNKPVKRGQ